VEPVNLINLIKWHITNDDVQEIFW